MTSDRMFEQSTSNSQGISTGWAEVPLLPHNIWHNPQAVRFSAPGHTPTTLECTDDHQMGVSSSSIPMFQFASSSLSSALSSSVLSSNPTPMHLRSDSPQYLTGNNGSPEIDPGSTPMDYDTVNKDHHPVDPGRGPIPAGVSLNPARNHSMPCFLVPRSLSDELLPDNAHPHPNVPNPMAEVPCVSSTISSSVPPMSPVHDMTTMNHIPGQVVPETLVLEEATVLVPPSRSEPMTSTRSKRGKPGSSYRLSSSLPVALG